MRLRNALIVLIVGLCCAATGFADTYSFNLAFDEGGHLSLTRTDNTTLAVDHPTVTATSGGFDSMNATLEYQLPSFLTFATADGTNRSAWVLSEPGNPNLVSDVVIFLGSNIFVYDQHADTGDLPELAKQYNTPVVFQTGLPTPYDASTPSGLIQDLQLQNTAPSLAGAFSVNLTQAEGSEAGTYALGAISSSQVGFLKYDGFTTTTSTVTFTDAVVPLPSAATAGLGLFGVLGLISGLTTLRRHRQVMRA